MLIVRQAKFNIRKTLETRQSAFIGIADELSYCGYGCGCSNSSRPLVASAAATAAAVADEAASALYGKGIKMAVDEVAWVLYWCPIESHIPPSLLFNQRPGVNN